MAGTAAARPKFGEKQAGVWRKVHDAIMECSCQGSRTPSPSILAVGIFTLSGVVCLVQVLLDSTVYSFVEYYSKIAIIRVAEAHLNYVSGRQP